MERLRELTAVSLFSGAGGMDVGFADAGFRILFANDIDQFACETYERNHDARIIEGPIDASLDELPKNSDIDAVFGGPPCQGFSVAGKMNPDDPRSKLLWSYFDVIDQIKPKVFVCENVKALGALDRWKDVRGEMFKRASEAGYSATIVILNAANFGVPQNRERMFMIGLRNDLLGLEDVELNAAINGALSKRHRVPKSVAEIVKEFGRAGTSGNERICNAVITYAKSPVLRPSPYAGMLFNGAGRPLRSHGVACTLPASMGGNKTPIVDEAEIFEGLPSFIENYHSHLQKGGPPRNSKVPSRLRRLTIDECLAIQTFPRDYALSGKRNAMFRQIGNAVPCDLAASIAQVLADVIQDVTLVLEQGYRDYLHTNSSTQLLCENGHLKNSAPVVSSR